MIKNVTERWRFFMGEIHDSLSLILWISTNILATFYIS